MNNRQRKILLAIFSDPVSGSIAWADVESLLVGIGCTVIEGSGSRVRFERDGHLAFFHRPHPEKEAKRYQIRDARRFLEILGVRP
ncbi:MAG: type II toxin-antitoxin system HicA family toxin [Allorhizobium sp.]